VTADYLDSDCLPLSIRIAAARKRALERIAAEAGMSAPQFVEHVLARLLTDGRGIENGMTLESTRR
jgi:hypothetical protein